METNQAMNELSAAIVLEMPNVQDCSVAVQVFNATATTEGTVLADAVQAGVALLSVDFASKAIQSTKKEAGIYLSRYLFAVAKVGKSSGEVQESILTLQNAIEAAATLRGVPLSEKWRSSSTLAGYCSWARTVYAAMAGTVTVELFDESTAPVPAMPELHKVLSLQAAYNMVQKAKKAVKAEAEARLSQAAQQDTLHETAAAIQGTVQAPPRLATDATAANEAAHVVEYVRSPAAMLKEVQGMIESCAHAGIDLDLIELMVYELRAKLAQETAKASGDDLPDATPATEEQASNG